MDVVNIEGVLLTPLKQIYNQKGNILHAIKKSEPAFLDFGEVYFTMVKQNEIKGWNKHKEATINLVVPIGKVFFVIYDDRDSSNSKSNFFKIELSDSNYQRLTIPPNLWVSFKGIGSNSNMIMNLSTMEHDQDELVKKEISEVDYDWDII